MRGSRGAGWGLGSLIWEVGLGGGDPKLGGGLGLAEVLWRPLGGDLGVQGGVWGTSLGGVWGDPKRGGGSGMDIDPCEGMRSRRGGGLLGSPIGKGLRVGGPGGNLGCMGGGGDCVTLGFGGGPGTREEGKEALLSAFDDVDLVQGHGVHHLLALLQLAVGALHELGLGRGQQPA